jgi:O-antigen chain-terminating methyltransferase
MMRSHPSEAELDCLMEKIRSEIAEEDRQRASVPPPLVVPEIRQEVKEAPVPAKRRRYKLKKLLRLDEASFVPAVFRAVMGREPTLEELDRHLGRLRAGRTDKVELIAELQATKEGRERAAVIKGMGQRRVAQAVWRLPLLGPILEMGNALVRLPKLARNVERVRRQTERLVPALDRVSHDVAASMDARLAGLAPEFRQLADGLGQLAGGLGQLTGGLDSIRRDVAGEFHAQRGAMAEGLEKIRGAVSTGTAEAVSATAARAAALAGQLSDIAGQLDRQLGRLDAVMERLDRLEALHAAQWNELAGRVDSLVRRLGEVDQRLAVVQRGQGAPRPVPAPMPALPAAEAPPAAEPQVVSAFDGFYAAFEDCFRGTREDIGQRQAAHLELVLRQDETLSGLPVIDLGCGRGEWLELLGRNGVGAVGIDLNQVFLAENRARGLEVVEADALAYLRGLPDGSARGVTGFHIIEHLPFPVLVAILDEALRVLADGGLVLFETPNPENLVTAAHKFYYDPTHRHPIPPEVAAFLLRSRGYRDVDILRLHENRDPAREQVPAGVLRDLLFGPQDYAVLGYR